jgi:hypothetical protein
MSPHEIVIGLNAQLKRIADHACNPAGDDDE